MAALAQAQAHGALVAMTDPERRQILFEHAALARGWFPIGLRMKRRVNNPFGVEGYRAIGTELHAAPEGPPDVVLFPCARGNGLYGTWLGLKDQPGPRPRLIACQPDSANSLEASLAAGVAEPLELPPSSSVAFSTRERQADAMAVRKGDPDALNFLNNWILNRTLDGWLAERQAFWFKGRTWRDQQAQ